MAIDFKPMVSELGARNRSIFVSSSIPDPSRWGGEFDPLEITDAVVALARACLSRGYRIVTAAHPTIAPLLLYVAAEFPRIESELASVRVYQSDLFEDVLPVATRRFEAEGVGEITWTPATQGDMPFPLYWNSSLSVMREQMLRDTMPSAAVFIGGMEGISVEWDVYSTICPGRPAYAVSAPGGAAAGLTEASPASVVELLRESRAYPALWARVIDDLERNFPE